MPHAWRIVKNSRVGGHRPIAEFNAELSQALEEFEAGHEPPIALHGTIRENLGLASGDQVFNINSLFTNPYPFLQSHGPYLCGLVSTPTSAEDGVSEFTSLFILASDRRLLTVIFDPETTYAGPFGQRLLNRQAAHERTGVNDVGTSILMVLRDVVTSLNFALRELELEAEHIIGVLREFGGDRKRDTFESLKRIEAHLVKMRIEIESLQSVTRATAEVLRGISEGAIDVDGPAQIFDRGREISAEMLAIQARQTNSVRDRLEGKVQLLSSKCETLRDKIFVEATHRFGAIAALLLVPTFIVGFYGQNLDFPDGHWTSGLGFSVFLIVASTAALTVYFRKRRWL